MKPYVTIALAALLLGAVHIKEFAFSPQEAALRALQPAPRPEIVRVNIAGPYATVLTRGGLMENSPVSSPILVKHFTFGWQALELVNFSCSLDQQMLGARDNATLMRGMPSPKADSHCAALRDDGDPAAVEAIRKQMVARKLVPSVIVRGSFALASWYGAGGGETLFKYCGFELE